MEFLVQITVALPLDLSAERRAQLAAAERERGMSLARDGVLCAIWRVPGRSANCGIWSAPDATVLHDALISLPKLPPGWEQHDIT